MIAGFVKVDRPIFYTKVWPKILQIRPKVDAIQSNLKQFKLGEVNTLLIHWGYKDPHTEEAIVVAVSENARGQLDEHWVMPSLVEG